MTEFPNTQSLLITNIQSPENREAWAEFVQILPHVDKALELSRVALLRAHQRSAIGETDAALSDVLAVFKLARDCGSSPLVIPMYVEASIERSAADIQKSFQQQRSRYAELHEIANLPYAERADRSKSLVKSSASSSKMEMREDAMRYVSTVMMPFVWSDVFTREEQMHVRRQLLEQALRVQLQGADAGTSWKEGRVSEDG